jgi:hypothetical protein
MNVKYKKDIESLKKNIMSLDDSILQCHIHNDVVPVQNSRFSGCKTRMELARGQLATDLRFVKPKIEFFTGISQGPITPIDDNWKLVPRYDWGILISTDVIGHHAISAECPGGCVTASVGLGNSGQWSGYSSFRGLWFDNSKNWGVSFKLERYPIDDHSIAGIITADGVEPSVARKFEEIMRPAIDDCMAIRP